jgi:hypothetical protein
VVRRKRVFTRRRDRSLLVSLFPEEVQLLAVAARDVLPTIGEPPDGKLRDRLYPRAYLDPTEEVAQADYDALVHDDLVSSRRAALELVAATAEHAEANARGIVELTLSPEQEEQWLTAVNDARLVIGTVLGVTDDPDDDTSYVPGDPRYELGVVYHFLTVLHGELVDLLLDELGPGGSDDDAPGLDGDPD